MSSQSNGLRFDIYERVHLPDEVAAIDELDEIELVPRIGIVQQEEQVLLKGHLLLTGVYRSEEQPLSEQSLEHWIPVEITLPLNRIHRLDDISVEIDNFDVDVLSTRTLNVTGVLSLFGIEIEQANPQESWQGEETFTVVHQREEEASPYETPPFFNQQPPFWTAEQQQHAEQQAQLWIAEQQRAEEQQARQLAEEQQARQLAEEQQARQWAEEQQARQERQWAVEGQPQFWTAEQQQYAEQQAQLWIAEQQRAEEQQARQLAEEQQARQWAEAEQRTAGAQTEALEASEALARVAQARERELLANARQEAAIQEAARQETARLEAALQEAAREEAALPGSFRQAAEPQELQVEIQRQELARQEEPPVQAWQHEPAYGDDVEPQPVSGANVQLEPHLQQHAVPPAAIPEVSSFTDVTVVEAESERKQPRVALAGKSAEDEATQQGAGNVSFRSLLQSSRREQEAKAAAEQNAQREAAKSRKTSGDAMEWKNLFYGRPSEDNAFRKVRICIVQREETLDVIAGRYQLQPREIALYNRLSDQSVSEGQVLYIP